MKVCLIFSLSLIAFSSAYASPQKIYTVDDTPVVNSYIHQALAIPYFFTVPKALHLPMKEAEGFAYEYIYDADRFSPTSNLGLRAILVNKNAPKKETAKQLAKILLPGDIILSYRKEWAGKGAYPHIQLGISHSSIAFIDDEGVARNLDLPLNEEYVQDAINKGPSYFSSKHFVETELFHVVRPRLTATQRDNVNKWSKLLINKARARYVNSANQVYPSQIGFNQDYLSPQIKGKNPENYLDGTFNLARIALGYGNRIANNVMFCSEMAWAILSLRNCDPTKDAAEFKGRSRPSCIGNRSAEIFPPLPLLGNILTEPNNPSARPGMVDGPLLLLQAKGTTDPLGDIRKIFAEENVQGRMSSGHNAVSNALPQELFAALEQYFQLTNIDPQQAAMAREQITMMAAQKGFSENYAPASFLLNALLPNNHSEKVFDYAFTVGYVAENTLTLARRTAEENLSYEEKRAMAIRRQPQPVAADYDPEVRRALASFDNLPTPMRQRGFCKINESAEHCQMLKVLEAQQIQIPYAD